MNNRSSSLVLILLLSLAAFFPSCTAQFVWDDQLLIQQNPWAGHWSSLLSIWQHDLWHDIPGEHRSNWYRPLMAVHIIVDEQFFGDNIFPRQLISVGWHLLAIILVFRYLEKWDITGYPQCIAASLFALHPFQMEVNRFIAARNDSMILVFALAGILCHQRRWAFLFFLLAMFSKESALILIPILLLGNYMQEEKDSTLCVPFLTAIIFYVFVRHFADLDITTLQWEHLAPVSLTYLSCLIQPWECAAAQAPLYANPPLIGLLIFLGFVFLWRSRTSLTILSLLLFVVFLLLGSLAAISSHSMAYRYMYLCFFALALVLGAILPPQTPRITAYLFAILLSIASAQSAQQWNSSQQLWSHAHQLHPSSFTACGLFKQEQNPIDALPLLQTAISAPAIAHCCFNATIYPLQYHSPQLSKAFGEYALSQGCPTSIELLAPLAMSNALLGNWTEAISLISSRQNDPWGYTAVITTAEGLLRDDRSALQFWATQGDGEDKEQRLELLAQQLIQASQEQ